MNIIDEKIEEIEEEIRKLPYHKATEHHIGKLKARIARLREEKVQNIFKASGGGGKGYAVKHTGDATIALVGPPSAGKSSILNKLTNAESKVGAYDFTTLNVVPGMMKYNGAFIQLLDIPGIIEGASAGKGRGKEVLSVARSADLILIIVDVKRIGLVEGIKQELWQNGIRFDQKVPNVTITKASSGGIKVNSTSRLTVGHDTVRELANEFRYVNAEITIKEDVTIDELIDVFMNNRRYSPYLIVVNKIDLAKRQIKIEKDKSNYVFISAEKGDGLDELRKRIWEKLKFIRIYTQKDGLIDKDDPLIIKSNNNLRQIIDLLGLDKENRYKRARINGPGARFPDQEVSLAFQPLDETIVEFC